MNRLERKRYVTNTSRQTGLYRRLGLVVRGRGVLVGGSGTGGGRLFRL